MSELRLDDLPAHLRRGVAPFYLIHGEEALLALEAADQIRAAARQSGFSEREVLNIEGNFDWSRLQEAASSVSLFAERKLLEIRLPSGKPGTEGAEALMRFAAYSSPDTMALLMLPRLEKAQLQSKWFTTLAQSAQVIAVKAVDRAALPRWIAHRLQQQDQQVDAETLAFFADRVEGNLLAARQEIAKLSLLYPAGKLSFDQVRQAVANVARFDIFGLSEAWLAGDVPRVVRMLDGLEAEGETPVLAVWSVAEELRTLLRLEEGFRSGRPPAQLFRENRVWGAKQRLIEPAIHRLSPRRMAKALSDCADIDRAIKGAGEGEPWFLLRRLLVGLC